MTNRGSKTSTLDKMLTSILCLFCTLVFSFAAQADEDPAKAMESSELMSTLGNKTKLSSDELDDQRAKAALEIHHVTINDQELNGVVSNNTAIGNNTGDNIVSDGAYSNAAGFLSTVQNSGNNVLIQNSTIINVAIEP